MKINNKGFTLVELIIVVAIIAVLATVLAPQYLQYVERSRESNDLQVATSIIDAATLAIADPENDVPPNVYVVFRWDTSDDPYGGSGAGVGNLYLNSERGGMGDVSSEEWLTNVNDSIRSIMGISGPSDSSIGDAQSANGNRHDLLFRINTSTGKVEVHTSYKTYWIDEIGVQADSANF